MAINCVPSETSDADVNYPMPPVIIEAHEWRFMSIPTSVTPFGVRLQCEITEFISLNDIPVDITELKGLPLLL